jgi:hypothetical protein
MILSIHSPKCLSLAILKDYKFITEASEQVPLRAVASRPVSSGRLRAWRAVRGVANAQDTLCPSLDPGACASLLATHPGSGHASLAGTCSEASYSGPCVYPDPHQRAGSDRECRSGIRGAGQIDRTGCLFGGFYSIQVFRTVADTV